MFMQLGPLRKYRDYRYLFMGQIVSFLGSMITYVAIPYQVYELTKSSLMVGLLGSVQLVPLLLFGIIGGSVADSLDRRKLLLWSEALMSVCALVLAFNATLPVPSIAVIFTMTGLMQAASGFHRPAMEALQQKLVKPEDYSAVAALSSMRNGVGAIIGPALGGVLIAFAGAKIAYIVDFGTFLFAVVMIWKMHARFPAATDGKPLSLENLSSGLRYAWKRPVLMGTYIVDIIAMTFAFPTALFPAMAEHWGGAKATGALFSAMSIGSLVVTAFSGWSAKVHRHGAAVVLAAAAWGLAIIALAYAPSLEMAILCLALAGGADMVSALFRNIIWNESIPNEMRGRMAGVEMISYMTGPLIGNTRAGWMAAKTSTHFSVLSGGVLCFVGVLVCALALPKFWQYRSQVKNGEGVSL